MVTLAAAGVMVVLALLLATFQMEVFRPIEWFGEDRGGEATDYTALLEAVDPAQVELRQREIIEKGPRFLGLPGATATAALMRDAFEAAGLEIFEHEVRTPSPVTEVRQVTLPMGEALDGVEVYPFFPNHLQPVTTGRDGIEANLVLLNDETIASGTDFTGTIGIVDAAPGNYSEAYGFDWVKYAQLGISALVVTDSRGLDEAPWHLIASRIEPYGMVSSVPVNFVRVASTPELLAHVGQTVNLKVITRYEQVPNKVIYGVLRAPGGADESVTVISSYDAMSILPDRSPGSMQAISPALQLQMVEGLSAYRDRLKRDIIFMTYGSSVMGHDGVNHLARILQGNTHQSDENPLLRTFGIESASGENQRLQHLRGRREENARQLELVEQALAVVQTDQFLKEPDATTQAMEGTDEQVREMVEDQLRYVLNTLSIEARSPMMDRKLGYLRTGDETGSSPEFKAYLKAKEAYDRINDVGGYAPRTLAERAAKVVAEREIDRLLVDRLRELVEYEQFRKRQIAQELEIAKLYDAYRDFAFFSPVFAPAPVDQNNGEIMALHAGRDSISPRVQSINDLVLGVASRLDFPDFEFSPGTRIKPNYISEFEPMLPEQTAILDRWGYAAYLFFNRDRAEAYKQFTAPFIPDYATNLESVRGSLAVFAASMLAAGEGEAKLEPSSLQEWIYRTYGGRVTLSNVGLSIVPDYPVAGAALANFGVPGEELYAHPGFYNHPIVMTDPYGRFQLDFNANDWQVGWQVSRQGQSISPIAAAYDEDGLINVVKDIGQDGQRLFKSVGLSANDKQAIGNMTIVTFRASPVALYDLTNPQSMQEYSGVRLLDADGKVKFRKFFQMGESRVRVGFMEPDQRAFVLLLAGTPENELVQQVRGFALNLDGDSEEEFETATEAPGYLVGDTSSLKLLPLETAQSMTEVNDRRLSQQQRLRMTDEQMERYHLKSRQALEAARSKDLSQQEEIDLARDSVTYATLNHPVIRDNINEAVVGIVWYLALLVPFVFFFEKLVFGFADVRKQLTAQGIIFLSAFLILRFLHPAFELVRSSVMILLGFVIIIISIGITLLFSSKFKENLEEIRKKQGKVTGAQANTMGIVASAFLLGLNNMHRRKVRTGLTCATLTLLTFVMISFTSTQSDIAVEDTAIGKAPYQGLLVRKDKFEPIRDSEVFAFESRYGKDFSVAPRRLYVGEVQDRKPGNPEFEITFRGPEFDIDVPFESMLQFSANEPLRDSIAFVTDTEWFPAEPADRTPIFIPTNMADQLGITADAVNAEPQPVRINGRTFYVSGIFEPESLEQLRDLDGRDLLPFDIEQMASIEEAGKPAHVVATESDPRISAAEVILAPLGDYYTNIPFSELMYSSLAVAMPDADYKDASDAIERFMEQTAQPVFYGLDGVAFRGKRTREATLAGMIDLIIPLLIAGLTVLNTMKGSVYERRDEIFVYNAVGIAPRYIFFMFIAEAFVYAVVGSVLGYFLSQGTGRVLTALDLTGGMNMTFASINTIYASLTIMAAVFISTYFPAKSAMEIAAPAEDSGWKLPEPEGDTLSFDLPFNFRQRGRMAVLSFFDRYLRDHSEGSAGSFFTGSTRMGVRADENDEYIPEIGTTVWLKPFDLAVSQRLIISMPVDEETGQFKARISLERLSGTRESWLRLNKQFVAQVRRHFLHWRAVTPEERNEMFHEAERSFRRDLLGEAKGVSA